PTSILFPYTTLFRSNDTESISVDKYYLSDYGKNKISEIGRLPSIRQQEILEKLTLSKFPKYYLLQTQKIAIGNMESLEDLKKDLDRKSTRLNSSHVK